MTYFSNQELLSIIQEAEEIRRNVQCVSTDLCRIEEKFCSGFLFTHGSINDTDLIYITSSNIGKLRGFWYK